MVENKIMIKQNHKWIDYKSILELPKTQEKDI